MAHVVTFTTALFDISKEEPNPINPIGGQALLKWLRDKLQGSEYVATDPATEDWGWYIDVEGNGSLYLVGASGEPEQPTSEVDWTIQIHKNRSLKDKLTGRNKMAPDDALTNLIERIIRDEPSFGEIHVEKDA